jgi:hypothetical protein
MRRTDSKRAFSPEELLRLKLPVMEFEGEWREAFGCPPKAGLWCVYGGSGSGKSSFAMQLAKYLCRFGKVFYNSHEEGHSKSFVDRIKKYGMREVNTKFVSGTLNIQELDERMSQPRKGRIYLIDSFQSMGFLTIGSNGFRSLCQRHPNLLIIFISRADGKQPQGRAGVSCMFDADVKIWVEGFRAFCKGRFQEDAHRGKYFTVWEEGAAKYWGE